MSCWASQHSSQVLVANFSCNGWSFCFLMLLPKNFLRIKLKWTYIPSSRIRLWCSAFMVDQCVCVWVCVCVCVCVCDRETERDRVWIKAPKTSSTTIFTSKGMKTWQLLGKHLTNADNRDEAQYVISITRRSNFPTSAFHYDQWLGLTVCSIILKETDRFGWEGNINDLLISFTFSVFKHCTPTTSSQF